MGLSMTGGIVVPVAHSIVRLFKIEQVASTILEASILAFSEITLEQLASIK